MKARGIRNRCRIFEIPKNVNYIIAKPRMQKYIDYAANVYAIYLRFFAKEDIHVYSIDEAFIDFTHYLKLYKTDPESLAKRIMDIILKELGITATAGVGTNLYLAKIALDITAKHVASNIGYLDENKFIEELGGHTNLTDFWQIGRGTEKRLHRLGIKNMNEIRETNPAILYKEFGINAELMIDHASGRESCTMADIKKYKSKSNSLSNSQILFRDYTYFETKTIVKEMCDLLSLNLIDKELETSVIGLAIGYSKDTRAATGMSMKLGKPTNTFTNLMEAYLKAYEKSTDKEHPIRRVRSEERRVGKECVRTRRSRGWAYLARKTKEERGVD